MFKGYSYLKSLFWTLAFLLSAASGFGQNSEPQSLQFIYANQDQTPVKKEFADLAAYLAEHPEVVEEVQKRGVIRIMVDNSMSRQDIAKLKQRVQTVFGSLKVKRRFEIIEVPIDIKAIHQEAVKEVNQEYQQALDHGEGAVQDLINSEDQSMQPDLSSQGKLKYLMKQYLRHWRTILGFPLKVVVFPAKELFYVAKTLKNSFVTPTKEEVMGGISSKAIPFGVGAFQNYLAYGDHLLHYSIALTLSFALDMFHGVWVSTWLNLQDRMAKERGKLYQNIFNWTYQQNWGIWFRLISYNAGISKTHPLSIDFLSLAGISSAVNTVVASFSYQGLNRLYQLGVYSYKGRAFRQQFIRDLPYMIEQTQLYIGGPINMLVFYSLWSYNQLQGSYYYLRSQLALHRPTIFIGPAEVIASEAFAKTFPDAIGNDPVPRTKLRRFFDQFKPMAKIKNVISYCKKAFLN